MGIPYFDLLFEARKRGEPVARLFERFVHWGYWERPREATGTIADFVSAMERLNQLVVDAAELRDGMKLVDAGCGFGGTLASIDAARMGMELYGVNIDGRQLESARETVKPRPGNTLTFIEGDACSLPFPDASFDRVLAVECIFHFPSRLGFLKEARRVLKPGGRLAISDFVPLWKGREGAAGWVERKVAVSYGPVNGWPDGDYHEMAGKAGLRVVHDRDITRQTLPTYPVIIEASREMAAATRILQWLSRLRVIRYRVLAFEKPARL